MCEGVADLFASLAKPENTILAGSAMKAFSVLSEGRGGAAMFDYQAAQAVADGEAERQLGEVKANKLRKLGGVVNNQAMAAQGASGSSVDSKSAQAVRAHIDQSAAEDALTEIYAGQARQRSANATAQNYRQAADNAMTTAVGGAAGSLLAGAGRAAEAKAAADRWIKRRNQVTEEDMRRAVNTFEPQASYPDL